MKKSKDQNAITLIALIITIIILLILAGISISALTQTGLFSRAKQAEQNSKMAKAKEEITLILNEWQIEKYQQENAEIEKFFQQKVQENILDKFENSEEEGKYNIYKDGYVAIVDKNGNIIGDIQKADPIPQISNIKITTDGKNEVENNSKMPREKLQVNFDANITNGKIKSITPALPYTTDGIERTKEFTVIGTVNGVDYTRTITIDFSEKYKEIEKLTSEKFNVVLSKTENKILKDEKENIIVLPAGFKITNDARTVDKGIVIEDATGKATNGSQFVWIPVGKITKADGNTETINLNRYTFDEEGKETEQNDKTIENYYQELEKGNKENTEAKSITDFKNSVSKNCGYYIGRYEARQNKEGKVTEIKSDTVWTDITQPNAATKARQMYDDTYTFTSDLLNSYAWDTATLFIQNCGTNKKYSRQNSLNTGSPLATGTTEDVQCNIFDMASNTWEWTTEYSLDSEYPCVSRGGSCYEDTIYMSRRTTGTLGSNNFIGFRVLLYL